MIVRACAEAALPTSIQGKLLKEVFFLFFIFFIESLKFNILQ